MVAFSPQRLQDDTPYHSPHESNALAHTRTGNYGVPPANEPSAQPEEDSEFRCSQTSHQPDSGLALVKLFLITTAAGTLGRLLTTSIPDSQGVCGQTLNDSRNGNRQERNVGCNATSKNSTMTDRKRFREEDGSSLLDLSASLISTLGVFPACRENGRGESNIWVKCAEGEVR
ncbi:hypothetical protein FA13DRAFT_1738624 [Coprinellus micaceus]|uniref:Uncharacterized protein n=1 Tax=Coprinellus micaceus TaxID=71717 RepID=A0A4Y7STK7_COPMI|nr:hypothetical protein FA13DRAFT_1738624 [Coprinellus micaceus]